MRSIIALCFLAVAAAEVGSQAQAADQLAGRLRADAQIYREPKPMSEVLGKMRQGTTLWLSGPAQGDFYPIAFPKPVKNASQGWIRASDLQVYNPEAGAAARLVTPSTSDPANSARRSGRGTGPTKNRLVLMGGMNFTSPYEWQLLINEPQSSVSLLRMGAEFRHRTSPLVEVGIGFHYLKMSKSSATPDSTGEYSVSGYGLHLPVALQFAPSWPFTLAFVGSLGLSMDTAGNANTTQVVSTSNIIAFELEAKLEGCYWFSKTFGLHLQAGYFMNKLSSVASLTALSTDATSADLPTADISLSSLGLGGGLSVAF